MPRLGGIGAAGGKPLDPSSAVWDRRSRRGGPFRALPVAIAILFSVPASAQSVQAEAPWLTVYDEAGRLKWELRMEALARVGDGWEGQRVQVQLYHDGAPTVILRAPRIRADRYGREWALSTDDLAAEPIVGEGEGFSFTCREARWQGGLVLGGLTAEGRGVALSAAEARWQLGEAVHLVDAEVTFAGWQLAFETGRYELGGDQLVADDVTATGHGVTLGGTALMAWPHEGRIEVREAHLVRAP